MDIDASSSSPLLAPVDFTPDAGLLNIQVHMERAPHLDADHFESLCRQVVEAGRAVRLSFVRSDDEGDHIDACFEAFNADELWGEVSEFILGDLKIGPLLSTSCVVLRTGEQGWDDARVLLSYD